MSAVCSQHDKGGQLYRIALIASTLASYSMYAHMSGQTDMPMPACSIAASIPSPTESVVVWLCILD